MNFNSPLFFAFLAGVILVNYFLSAKYRSNFLLFASFVFIGYYNIASLVFVLAFSLINFFLAKKVNNNKALYLQGIAFNIFSLLITNYLSLKNSTHYFQFDSFNFSIPHIVFALGISFYSLQNIAYLTDIYNKQITPYASVGDYALYNAFFPKLISGPLMPVQEFIPQINKHPINQTLLISGFNRFLIGLVKKVVIADNITASVHSIFDYSDDYHGLTTLTGIYLFSIELYFDFSGYTDMAIGMGKMLGYELKENFKLPFRSTSVTEFWRRWHISLMDWLTQYIFYPFVYFFRKHSKIATLVGITLIFFASSVWRGFSYTFLIWAACHSAFLIFEFLTKDYRLKFQKLNNNLLYKVVCAFVVFNAVAFSNIFFRAHSMEKALQLVKNAFRNFMPSDWLTHFVAPLANGGHQIEQFNLIMLLLIPVCFLLFERKIETVAADKNYRIGFVIACILLLMLFGEFNQGSRFIYIQY